jgi:molybdate transport system ATP-binding protein
MTPGRPAAEAAPAAGATDGLDAHVRLRRGALDLDVAIAGHPGTITAVLGPNGAGKTTLLEALVGTLAIDDGHLRLGGRSLDDPATGAFVPPEGRRVGYVPQDLLLLPHLRVVDNVAFGLRAAGRPREVARAVAMAWLEVVGLADRARDRPASLSGGQAQRVALARALAVDPALLLLDEPLAALDASTRGATRRDLRAHLAGVGAVTVLVTHDPLDALTLAHDVVVLEAGRVTQAGPTAEVAARPRTRYVADLLGVNLLEGTAAGREVRVGAGVVELAEPVEVPGGRVLVAISPSAVTLHLHEPAGSARNRWPATVADVDLLGERVRVRTEGPVPLTAEVTTASLADLAIDVGTSVWISIKATEVRAYPA